MPSRNGQHITVQLDKREFKNDTVPFRSTRQSGIIAYTYAQTHSCANTYAASARLFSNVPLTSCRICIHIGRVFGEPLYKRKLGDTLSKEKVDKYFFFLDKCDKAFKLSYLKLSRIVKHRLSAYIANFLRIKKGKLRRMTFESNFEKDFIS